MIRKLVDFALNNRFLIVIAALALFVWGAVAFHQLPVEAYPDVANNYVEVITQWPGISAEQIEQQVSIPLEIVMNGIPGLVHLRSFSLFGLSDLKLVFDDDEENAWNRERVLERLSQVTLPPTSDLRACGFRGPRTTGLFLSLRAGADRCRGGRHPCGTCTNNSLASYRPPKVGAVLRAAKRAFPWRASRPHST